MNGETEIPKPNEYPDTPNEYPDTPNEYPDEPQPLEPEPIKKPEPDLG